MGEYITKSGETLAQIATRTGISVETLKKYNHLHGSDNFVFSGQSIKIPDINSDKAFRIPGLSIEKPAPATDTNKSAARATKHSNVRATAKDIELLKKNNASLDKNDPDANAQFVEGDGDFGDVSFPTGEVYISAAHSAAPTENDTLESPEEISIRDNTNGHYNRYYYVKLTPEYMDGKHFAKFGKNKQIDMSQFEPGKTYYILTMAYNEETHERLDYTDHLEIYRLDYSYDADSDTST